MIAFASNLPDWNALHFLRPEWLWALLALPLIIALALYRQLRPREERYAWPLGLALLLGALAWLWPERRR
ncbi:hypothetical protein C7E12_19470 [Stenotrophomonas maltophilia]|nr:hypothetical protein C7E12_19470 [Stenotrophomonas maltophilia]